MLIIGKASAWRIPTERVVPQTWENCGVYPKAASSEYYGVYETFDLGQNQSSGRCVPSGRSGSVLGMAIPVTNVYTSPSVRRMLSSVEKSWFSRDVPDALGSLMNY